MATEAIIANLQDYMFTSDNISRFTKHMIPIGLKPTQKKHYEEPITKLVTKPVTKNIEENLVTKNIEEKHIPENIEEKPITKNIEEKLDTKPVTKPVIQVPPKPKFISKKETIYRPRQKDSLFWCFYILKNGFSNYEMEINNQYFVVEKTEKFKYIELIRKNKDILKIHKIKPLTELEDDLANKDKISVKTFFALCVLEDINVLLVDKRKILEITCKDIDDEHPVNIIHRNSKTYEHHIELDVTPIMVQQYRDTYYTMSSFDATIKSMGSYKLDELTELCKKLNINIDSNEKCSNEKPSNEKPSKKKIGKKDIYELLVLNY
jgi:hypothetical protein